jgi:hypothetical protein
MKKHVQLPLPLHKYGYYGWQLEDMFTKKELNKFYAWYNGQTGMMDENGNFIYYMEDVNRYIALVVEGKTTYFD